MKALLVVVPPASMHSKKPFFSRAVRTLAGSPLIYSTPSLGSPASGLCVHTSVVTLSIGNTVPLYCVYVVWPTITAPHLLTVASNNSPSVSVGQSELPSAVAILPSRVTAGLQISFIFNYIVLYFVFEICPVRINRLVSRHSSPILVCCNTPSGGIQV